MAETVKGINVVIGSETTGLNKALGDVNKASRDVQAELKQVEKLLKLDPSNTELVAQKQKLLGNAVENTKQKLDTLRSVQEQVNKQFADGKISEGQYRAFQREIAKAEQELKGFEDRAKETKKTLADMASALKDTGEKMTGIGEKMSVGVTAPIVAAGGLIVKGAMDAQAAQGKLQASLGLTADEAKKLEGIAQQVWKNGFGENIQEVNAAITSVRQNMSGLKDNELAGVTEGAMTIAQTFDEDVNEVTKAAGVMMKNFGISGQQALDIITVGYQKGGNFSGELLDTLREYSPQFASLGLSADKAMAILISGAEAGAWNLDKVGDSMKEFNIRAQDGSKTTADGFAKIGLDAAKMGADIASGGDKAQAAFIATVTALSAMKDPIQQNAAGTALFGTQWEDVRSKVIGALADGQKGLGEFEGATQKASNALSENDPFLAITKSLREIQSAIGPALLPLANIVSNTVAPAIKSLADGFTSLGPTGQKVILTLAGIAAVIGPLLVAIGSVVGAVGTITAAFGTATAAGGIIATVFGAVGTAAGVMWTAITGPVGLVIAAIALVVAAGVALYKNWDTVKVYWNKAIEGIKNVSVTVFNAIGGFFKKWWPEMLAVATGPIGLLVLLIYRNFDKIQNTIRTVMNSVKSFMGAVMNGITSSVKSAINTIIRSMNSMINALNKVHFKIPDWFPVGGGSNFGFHIPNIPMLADGGIVNSKTLAMIAEAGKPEVVSPLDKLFDMIKEAVGGGGPGLQISMAGLYQGANLTIRNEDDIYRIGLETARQTAIRAQAAGIGRGNK